MSDKELLELAAKAAGYPISEGHFEEAAAPNAWWGWVYVDGSGDPPDDSAWTELWNPLTDDGDALRLAVKLDMNVALTRVDGYTDVAYGYHDRLSVVVPHGDDPYAATRRAIVRAAAEIGKAMTKE